MSKQHHSGNIKIFYMRFNTMGYLPLFVEHILKHLLGPAIMTDQNPA